MILLAANVISEPLRHAPEPRVVDWIDAQAMENLFLSAITVAELRAGVSLLPAGRQTARKPARELGKTRAASICWPRPAV